MATEQSKLLRGRPIPIAESVFLSEGLGEDIVIRGMRLLLGGLQETDNSKFDQSIFGVVAAGSLVAETKGACRKYVRIS